MGRLIVLEGIDGSGKSTQLRLLCDYLRAGGRDFRVVSFPRYSEPSSALVRMYLAGDFGNNPGDVNVYAASTFFAVDRYASYRLDWGEYLSRGGVVIMDRYVTSNAIHQGAKLTGDARRAYFDWLYDFEFNLLRLPRPDLVLYMDLPASVARMRINEREGVSGGDIHERDDEYLARCAECADEAADFYGWHRIACLDGGIPRAPEDICGEVRAIVAKGAYDG